MGGMPSVKHPIRTVALLLALLPSPAHGRPPSVGHGGGFVRGMALGMYSGMPQDLDRKLREVRALGVSHVSLVVSWSMDTVRSTTIAPRKGWATPDDVLVKMIRRSKAMGLEVFLFPIIEVHQRSMGQWRGTIKPPSWDTWWRQYTRFIMHYARISARSGVAIYSVGSELVSTEHDRKRWSALIGQVRSVYTGKLAYSANWDHYSPVRFWDLVDVTGLTAYYKIAEGNYATEEWMTLQWKKIRKDMSRWSRRVSRRPFIFTEVGYPSRDGGAVEPWDYTKDTPVDLEEQRRAFAAFVKAWQGSKQLAGVFFWDWYGDGGAKCRRYTPRRKPASRVIRRWFQAKKKLHRARQVERGRGGWGEFPSRCLDDRMDRRGPCR